MRLIVVGFLMVGILRNAHATDECSAAVLPKGRTFVELFKSAMQTGDLTVAQLELVIASSVPKNPFADRAVEARHLSLEAAFSRLIREPFTQQTWVTQRHGLEALRESSVRDQLDTAVAKDQTRAILRPELVRLIPADEPESLSWTKNAEGLDVLTFSSPLNLVEDLPALGHFVFKNVKIGSLRSYIPPALHGVTFQGRDLVRMDGATVSLEREGWLKFNQTGDWQSRFAQAVTGGQHFLVHTYNVRGKNWGLSVENVTDFAKPMHVADAEIGAIRGFATPTVTSDREGGLWIAIATKGFAANHKSVDDISIYKFDGREIKIAARIPTSMRNHFPCALVVLPDGRVWFAFLDLQGGALSVSIWEIMNGHGVRRVNYLAGLRSADKTQIQWWIDGHSQPWLLAADSASVQVFAPFTTELKPRLKILAPFRETQRSAIMSPYTDPHGDLILATECEEVYTIYDLAGTQASLAQRRPLEGSLTPAWNTNVRGEIELAIPTDNSVNIYRVFQP